MSHLLRNATTAGLLAIGMVSSLAVAEDRSIDQLKRDMVEAALSGSTASDSIDGLARPIDRSAALLRIEIDSTIPEPTIDLTTTTAVIAVPTLNPDANLLTIDLHGAIVVPEVKTMVLDGGVAIAGVTTYLAEIEPQFVTRIEVALSRPVAYRVAHAGERIHLVLSPTTKINAISAASAVYNKTAPLAALSTLNEIAERSDDRAKSRVEAVGAAIAAATYQIERVKVALLERDLSALASHQQPNVAADLDLAIHRSRFAHLSADYTKLIRTHRDTRTAILHGIELLPSSADPAPGVSTAQRIQAAINEAIENEKNLQSKLDDLELGIREAALNFDQNAGQWVAQPARANSAALDELESQLRSLRAERPAAARSSVDALSDALDRVKLNSPAYTVETNRHVAALIDPEDEEAEKAKENVDGQQGEDQSMPPPPARRNAPPVAEAPTFDPSAPVEKVTVIATAAEEVLKAEEEGQIVLAQNETAQEDDSVAKMAEDGSLTVNSRSRGPAFHLYNPNLPPDQDPLQQLVNLDFVEMDLSTVVGLLARKAQINVIANENIQGSVTASLQNIPLGKAIEVVLRMNNLGIIEEDGVFRITSYEEAVASRRETRMIPLKNASAEEVRQTMQDVISGQAGASLMSIGANATTNYIILSGPSELVADFEKIVRELDVADQVIPTITAAIKLNYAEPEELIAVVQPLLSAEAGRVSSDLRGRHLIVTDLPVKVEEIQDLVKELDLPVKQVNISTMIVDALLSDDAQTGVDWLFTAIRRTDSSGNVVSNLSALEGRSDFTTGPITPGVPGINLGSQIMFGILSGDVNISAAIAAEVRSNNAQLLANPSIVTVENKPARISIADEVPYQELTQSLTGPPIATTEFKEIGTVLEVTPRVTHDNHILIDIEAKQSDTTGVSVSGVPEESKREATTTLRLADGQTVYIGGLRRFDDDLSVRKTPILGDIPVLNLLFRNQQVTKESIELLIFLTCHVLPDDVPDLTPAQKGKFDMLGGLGPDDVDGTRALVHNTIYPQDQRDPFWKWRRAK